MSTATQIRSKNKYNLSRTIEQDSLYFRARDCVWKKLSSRGDFWICELVREGHSFTDKPRKVALLPYLEDIEPITSVLFEIPKYPEKENPINSKPPETDALRVRAYHDPMSNERLEEKFLSSTRLLRESSAVQFRSWQYLPLLKALESPFPRLLIADDVGLGKTTEAALVLQHLVHSGRADRILVICPAHLCDKWQSELSDRFGIQMEIFDRDTRRRFANQGVRNPYEVADRVIVSMDFAKRFENLKPLSRVDFDCVIVDECHHFMTGGNGMSSRLRELAESICIKTPSLLLLSATPFRGGQEEFESLLALLDPIALERDQDGELSNDARNSRERSIIRRIKKDVSQGDFPERQIRHLVVEPESAAERSAVAKLRTFIDSLRNDTASEAPHLLAEIFQKRASSSWNALSETLKGHEAKLNSQGFQKHLQASADLRSCLDLLSKDIFSQSKIKRLISELQPLIESQKRVVIFTEYIDSLDVIFESLSEKFKKTWIGCITGSEAWAWIDGNRRDDLTRHDIEQAFCSENSKLQILICTDTCSEGIDLQKQCHHLIHFELPWSLVKLEQRNGRIDRFGQQHAPQIFNMVLKSEGTRDQQILAKISERIEEARKNLGSVSSLIDESDVAFSRGMTTCLLRGEDPSDAFGEGLQAETKTQYSQIAFKHPDLINKLQAQPSSQNSTPLWQLNLMVLRAVIEGTSGRLEETPTKGIFKVALPDDWEVGSSEYPTPASPWNVIFDPTVAVQQEQKRLRDFSLGLDTGKKLHFLSSNHPLNESARRRYQLMLFKNGSVPLLVAPLGPGSKSALVVEASLMSRGERGIIIWKRHFLIDEQGDLLAEGIFGRAVAESAPIKSGDRKSSLMPNQNQWRKMIEQAQTIATQRAQDFFAKQKSSLELEAKKTLRAREMLSDKQRSRANRFMNKHVDARETWLDELCLPALREETKEPAVRVQPFALLLSRGDK